MRIFLEKSLFFGGLLAACFGLLSGAMALMIGVVFSLCFTMPYKKHLHIGIQYFLKIAVIGLGFGMNLTETIAATSASFKLTFFSVVATISVGLLLSKFLKIDKKLGHLITSGTTICGGSAIAAVSPVIQASSKTISIALGIVFLLNSIALLLFPVLGHYFGLSQHDFGLWCAIAIHDTSSVVGAALSYGEEALKIATTVKLSRTLWIIPLSVFSVFVFKTSVKKIRIPYFILLFIVAVISTDFELVSEGTTMLLVLLSKRILVLTLFLVGTSISVKDIKSTGYRPLILAVVLWVFIAVFSLVYILFLG
ncbi:MAG: putative sulfate exporter family transporter [Flavobacteriaceae bacterium]|nr:MAG: putative sulfate exporter family transporter [Flavobacteriaceae bacterium]